MFHLIDGNKIGRRILPEFYETVSEILKAITIKDQENKIYFTYNEKRNNHSEK